MLGKRWGIFMPKLGLIRVASLLAVLMGTQAWAQAPLPSEAKVPEKMPFDVPYGPSVDLARAKELAAVAEAEARKHNWKMAIAVVDIAGELVYFEKIDDTQFASVAISQDKAYTAARFRRATAVFYDGMETGHPSVATLDARLRASPGGVLLVEHGKLIGAIGYSGGAGCTMPSFARQQLRRFTSMR